MKSITQISSSFFMIAALAIFSAGCSVDNTATNATGDEDTGEVENIPDTDDFQVMVNTNNNYQVVISEGGDGSTPCIAEEGEDILCVVDMFELDMYMRGFTLNDAFPADMCAYRGFHPYYYMIAPMGDAPTHVFYETDADDNITTPTAGLDEPYDGVNTLAGLLGGESDDIYYRFGSTWYSHNQLFGRKAADAESIRCPWDYSKISDDYPNCCYSASKYSLLTVNSDGEEDETVGNDWGGSRGSCLEGPGMDWADQVFDRSGMPTYRVTNVDSEDGINGTFPVPAPVTKSLTLGRAQVYAASYYDPANHGGDVPAMTRIPRVVWSGSGVIDNSAHIQYDCLDEAFETVARIRVSGREWNDYDDFVAFLAGSGSVSNADRTGTEAEPVQSTGDDTISPALGQIDDFPDWTDIVTNESSCEFGLTGKNHSDEHFGLTNVSGGQDSTDLTYVYTDTAGADDYLGFILDEPD